MRKYRYYHKAFSLGLSFIFFLGLLFLFATILPDTAKADWSCFGQAYPVNNCPFPPSGFTGACKGSDVAGVCENMGGSSIGWSVCVECLFGCVLDAWLLPQCFIPPPPLPTVSISAAPSSIIAGQSSTLSWNTTNAVSCWAWGDWGGVKPTSGAQAVSPGTTSTYGITCLNAIGNQAFDTTTITVTPLCAAPNSCVANAAVCAATGGSVDAGYACLPAGVCCSPAPCVPTTVCAGGHLRDSCTGAITTDCGGRGCTSVPLQCNPIQYTLIVSRAGGGAGTVTSAPAGINCGGACSAFYNDGTTITLTAAPAGADSFQSWSVNCTPLADPRQCQITLTSNQTVTATFNQAPQVDAGADQSVPLTCPPTGCSVNATLSGIVTDDGIPGPYTVEWRLVAGDATKVTIAAPDLETTTVTITGSGYYRFELTANDGSATGSDRVDVRVLNDPPQVNIAGPAVVEVKFGFLPIMLQGIANDDGRPAPPGNLEVRWSGLGPGIATFSNPEERNTELRFSQSGVYIITFGAEDGELPREANVEVRYGAPERYGLIPCGVIIDNPATPWNETEGCQLRHTLLLLRNVIDFTLWRLIPLVIAVLVVATGAIFFFQFGGPEVMAKVRRIWSAIFKGVLILLFSWLFLNFLLGILGFDISIFGQWYAITP